MTNCTEVYPYLWIGNYKAARPDSIREHNFRAILNVGSARLPREWPFPPKSCSYFQVCLQDGKQNPWWLVQYAVKTLDLIINQHYHDNILVYCIGGRSRSPQIAALYLQYRQTKTITPTVTAKIWSRLRKKDHMIIEYPSFLGLDYQINEPEVIDGQAN